MFNFIDYTRVECSVHYMGKCMSIMKLNLHILLLYNSNSYIGSQDPCVYKRFHFFNPCWHLFPENRLLTWHTHTHTENVCMPVLRKNIKILIYCISRINNVIPNNIINSYRQVNASHTTSDIFSIESSKSMFCQGFFSFVILFLCSSTVAFSLNSMWNNLWVVLISTETINTAKPLNPSLCCVLNGHV